VFLATEGAISQSGVTGNWFWWCSKI
jgi:hypothetical protein